MQSGCIGFRRPDVRRVLTPVPRARPSLTPQDGTVTATPSHRSRARMNDDSPTHLAKVHGHWKTIDQTLDDDITGRHGIVAPLTLEA